jgi:hypothetical protein
MVYYQRSAFYCAFLVRKRLDAKDIHEEMFPVYCGKCLSRRVTTGPRNSLKDVRKSQMMKRRWESGSDNSQKLLCCGFRRTGKAMRQVYQCWWRICREINVLSRIEYHMFYVLYPFADSPSYLARITNYEAFHWSVYLHSHVSSSHLYPIIFNIFSNTLLRLCAFLRAADQVSHPYNTCKMLNYEFACRNRSYKGLHHAILSNVPSLHPS